VVMEVDGRMERCRGGESESRAKFKSELDEY